MIGKEEYFVETKKRSHEKRDKKRLMRGIKGMIGGKRKNGKGEKKA
jgi:hypothetical protein